MSDPSFAVDALLQSIKDSNTQTVMKYRTQLKESDRLLKSCKSKPLCSPEKANLKRNIDFPLALATLPRRSTRRSEI
ncbi:hypothetical protein LINPERHAP1_LOCUS18041 [Linum perenne]